MAERPPARIEVSEPHEEDATKWQTVRTKLLAYSAFQPARVVQDHSWVLALGDPDDPDDPDEHMYLKHRHETGKCEPGGMLPDTDDSERLFSDLDKRLKVRKAV